MSEAALREAEREAILEAAPFAVGVALALTALAVVSAQADWRLFDNVGWWLWAVTAGAWGLLALVLLMGLSTAVGRRDVRRRLVQTLLALAVLLSVVQTALLVASLVNASDVRVTGPQLLQSGATLWFSNVVAFGLAFWTMDAGGPVRRAVAQTRTPVDFYFPQDTDDLRGSGWVPHLVRLPLRLPDQLDRVQPHRHDAAHAPGEGADGARRDGVGDHAAPGGRPGGEHPRVRGCGGAGRPTHRPDPRRDPRHPEGVRARLLRR